MNLVVLNGRLTSKPELKKSASGKEYCQFTLAVRRYYTKDSKDNADFIECVAYGNLARHIVNNFDKGTPMLVKDGSINTRTYNLAGKQINMMQVVVLSVQYNLRDEKNRQKLVPKGLSSNQSKSNTFKPHMTIDDDLDDELFDDPSMSSVDYSKHYEQEHYSAEEEEYYNAKSYDEPDE